MPLAIAQYEANLDLIRRSSLQSVIVNIRQTISMTALPSFGFAR
jgi:hypothetical protein